MIISHKHKFIFFKPMKVAGSSIEVALSNICGPQDIQTGSEDASELASHGYTPENNTALYHPHTPPRLLYKKTGHEWKNYTKLAVVRNPWDLIVSYYWWSFNAPTVTQVSAWSPNSSDTEGDIRTKFQGYLEQMTFFAGTPYGNEGPETVIKWLAEKTHEFYDKSIDRIIRFENLQEEFSLFCEDLGTNPPALPRLKSGQRKNNMHYKEYYDDYSSFLVKKEFRQLIDRFAYEF